MISTLVGGEVTSLTGPEQKRFVGHSKNHVIEAPAVSREELLETIVKIVIGKYIVYFLFSTISIMSFNHTHFVLLTFTN